jgi:hypothetical protein
MMMNLDIQNLNTSQTQELIFHCQEKINQLQFQALKMRRNLSKVLDQEQKWREDIAIYQKRMTEGQSALQVLTESNPFYHKIKMDVQKCEIRILELEIRLQRFNAVQKTEKLSKIMALEASITYYEGLAMELENTNPSPKIENVSELLVDRPLAYELFNHDENTSFVKPRSLQELGIQIGLLNKASVLKNSLTTFQDI